ncbi:MAG: hypothetical protein AABX54_02385 [Nanoarchaeota archaeon]
MVQTSLQQAEYRQDLGDEMHFEAFSLDPNINDEGLAGIVNDLANKPKPNQELVDAVIRKGSVRWIGDIELNIARNPDGNVKHYEVPAPLREYRKALGESLDAKAKINPNIFNGPVIVAEGEIKNPLRVMQGDYYDFSATKLNASPGDLVPMHYKQGKTVEQVLADAGLGPETRERYFGLAHLMWPSNGQQFLLVQRAKGMGIAADCLATPGSTPDIVLDKPGLGKPGFGIREYWSYHIAEEMKDEFALKWGDFWIDGIGLYDDLKTVPFGAINIYSEMSVKQIAQGIYNAKPAVRDRVLTEHNIVFSVPTEAVPKFLERFPVFYSLYTPIKDALKEKGISK